MDQAQAGIAPEGFQHELISQCQELGSVGVERFVGASLGLPSMSSNGDNVPGELLPSVRRSAGAFCLEGDVLLLVISANALATVIDSAIRASDDDVPVTLLGNS